MKFAKFFRYTNFEIKKLVFSTAFVSSIILVVASSFIWAFSQQAAEQIVGDGINNFLILSMRFNFNFLFPFLALIFSSISINQENNIGIFATLTSSYLSYKEILFGKISSLIFFFILLILISIIVNLVLGVVLWGYNDIQEEGILILNISDFIQKFILVSILPIFSIAVLISLGMLFSALLKNIIASISGVIGLFLLLDVVKELVPFTYLMPINALDIPFVELVKYSDNYLLGMDLNLINIIVVPTLWIIILFGLSVLRLKKMDFHV